ncbi:hypothetical protein BaOVIS_025260 [Babesia ovis]|uniref:Uncharacterized protein n=1 Tax=Babesia ovis TaxID=5869 RepID=A0A9W5WW84_BABOV|nr:hypothetical protein BaOVIS_025260 [Babesia ovis]
MASSRGGGNAAAAKTIYYHSAIGTHRLQPRPLKNILYPYYRQYKPVYRARNPRTPNYYWPDIDKYPWHSHQKRFPKAADIGISIFSEFAQRDPKVRTLFETLHPLPLHGVNCLVWKPMRDKKHRVSPADETHSDKGAIEANIEAQGRQRITKVNGCYYVTDANMRNNICYVIKHVDYKLRPFKAKVVADMYITGGMGTNDTKEPVITTTLLRRNVSPLGSIRGEWRWSPEYKLKHTGLQNTSPLEALCVKDNHLFRGELAEFSKQTGSNASAEKS